MDTRAFDLTTTLAPAASRQRRLRVGVLVDLALGPRSGGHVRCWERLAEAALHFPDLLDLTIHFSGAAPEQRPLGDTVRYVITPPAFSTQRLAFLSHVPDHTDLAPWHRTIARALPNYDVIHTTDAYFAYARTALRIGRRHGIPIVSSVHTNTPGYARIYTTKTVERVFGSNGLARLLLHRWRVAERVEAHMQDQLIAHQRRCAFVLVSRPDQLGATQSLLGGRAALLRRGVDHCLFSPTRRDRWWLAATYGVPPDRAVVLYAGRVNDGKNVMLLVDAMGALLARGADLHLFCAGDGNLRQTIIDRLGARATCPGSIEPAERLARIYASADIFAFPSRIEESANVVLEALASGLPPLLAGESGMGRMIEDGETGFVLAGDRALPWVETIALLAADPRRRRGMGGAARWWAERHIPSWTDVLMEDLFPCWLAAARSHRATASAIA